MSKYAIEKVEWGAITGLEPGPQMLSVDPECETRVVPAAAYESLLEVATEMAHGIETVRAGQPYLDDDDPAVVALARFNEGRER